MTNQPPASEPKRIALITGANQDVSFQVAKELVANGVTVLVGSRNFETHFQLSWTYNSRLEIFLNP